VWKKISTLQRYSNYQISYFEEKNVQLFISPLVCLNQVNICWNASQHLRLSWFTSKSHLMLLATMFKTLMLLFTSSADRFISFQSRLKWCFVEVHFDFLFDRGEVHATLYFKIMINLFTCSTDRFISFLKLHKWCSYSVHGKVLSFPIKTDVTVCIPPVLTHLPSSTNKHAFDGGYGSCVHRLNFKTNKKI
jgi:hypothetical protein